MQIYLVLLSDHECSQVVSAFSTRPLAEEFIRRSEPKDMMRIEPIEIDVNNEKQVRPYWTSWKFEDETYHNVWEFPEYKVADPALDYIQVGDDQIESFISAEHAKQILKDISC